MPGPRSILLDCDPGHDDAVAILLAAGRPDAVDVRAVTTVGGNAELQKVTLNARRVLTLAGATEIPVSAGAAGPRRGDLITALDVHGQSGLDGAELPEPAMALDPRGAVELMVDRGPATVVATGPLTNVAALLEHSPQTVQEIVWMGGSTARGNTRPYAEFNALVDPEAAEIVFSSGKPLTMVGLNLTHQAQATPEVIERLRAVGNPAAEATIGWLTFFADTYRTVYGMAGPPVHDACAVALMIDSSVCAASTPSSPSRPKAAGRGGDGGRPPRGLEQPPNAKVAMELDVPRFWDLVIGAIGRCDRRRRLDQPRPRGGGRASPDAGGDRARRRPPRAPRRQGRQPGGRSGAPGGRRRDGRPRGGRRAGRAAAGGPRGEGVDVDTWW